MMVEATLPSGARRSVESRVSQPISFRQRLARNTAASIATNLWTIVLTLVSLPLLLHGLGTEAFGVWAFLQTFSATNGWLSVPATGLSVSSSRVVAAAGADRRAAVAGATFTAFSIAGTCFGLLIALTAPAVLEHGLDLGSADLGSLRVIAVAFGLQVAFEHVALASTSIFEGLQDVARARLLDSGRRTLVTFAITACAMAGVELPGVAVASAAATVIAVLATLTYGTAAGSLTARRPTSADVRGIASYAVTVSALTGTGVLHRTMDRTIAGVALGPSAVALVEIANQLQAGSTALLSAATYPVLSSAPWLEARDDRPALRELFARTTRYSLLLTLPIAALTIALAGPFVGSWVGGDYTEAVGLTQVAVLYVILAAPLQAGSNLLQGSGRAGKVLRASTASVLANLVASVVLVQVVGLVGVFIGTIVGVLVLLPLLLREFGPALAESPAPAIRRSLLTAVPPAAAGGAAAMLVTLTSWSDLSTLIIGGGIGILVATMTALGTIQPAERNELLASLRRRRSTHGEEHDEGTDVAGAARHVLAGEDGPHGVSEQLEDRLDGGDPLL